MKTTADIAAEWRKEIVSNLAWVKSPNQAGAADGEAGGCFVEAPGVGRRAYLKPITDNDDDHEVCRAAREKTASDLAHDLGLPVPPAILSTYGKHSKPVVVSLVLAPRQWSWEQVRNSTILESAHGSAHATVMSRGSHMLAFDTWLQQSDHGDHPHNIVWGYDPKTPGSDALIFLDYSFSMGCLGDWSGQGWSTVGQAPFPPLLLKHLDKVALSDTISRIEALPDESIKDIVHRLPEAYMRGAQKDVLATGLLGRRSMVRTALTPLL